MNLIKRLICFSWGMLLTLKFVRLTVKAPWQTILIILLFPEINWIFLTFLTFLVLFRFIKTLTICQRYTSKVVWSTKYNLKKSLLAPFQMRTPNEFEIRAFSFRRHKVIVGKVTFSRLQIQMKAAFLDSKLQMQTFFFVPVCFMTSYETLLFISGRHVTL